MTLKENNKITDQAWNRLYNRLDEEGLLEVRTSDKRPVLRSATFKWVASIAVICICIASVSVIQNRKSAQIYNQTLSNGGDAPTLVSTLEDGSVVYLANHTSLQYPDHFPKDRRQVFLQGDAFFDISKNKEKPFIIDTEQTMIEVLGTAFNVKSKDESFSLSVQRGEVKITSKKDGKFVYVKAGETALFQSDKLQTMQTIDAGQFGAYLKKVQFKDERLADIVHVININSGSSVLQVAPGLEDRLLTVTFSDDTPYSVAKLICMALDLKLTQKEDTIIISE